MTITDTRPSYCQTNRQTLYELAAIHPDGRRVLIAYSAAKGRTNLWHALTSDSRIKRIVKLCGTDHIDFGKRAIDGATMGEWTIRYTNRTARECQGRELPFIVDIIGE